MKHLNRPCEQYRGRHNPNWNMKIAVIPIFNPKVAGRGVKANNMDLAGCPRSALQVSHLLCGRQSAGSPGAQPTTRQSNQPSTIVLMWALGVKIAIVR